jgi:hypothetical protein
MILLVVCFLALQIFLWELLCVVLIVLPALTFLSDDLLACLDLFYFLSVIVLSAPVSSTAAQQLCP